MLRKCSKELKSLISILVKLLSLKQVFCREYVANIEGLESMPSWSDIDFDIKMNNIINVNNKRVNKKFLFDTRCEEPFVPRNYLKHLSKPDKDSM